MTNSLEQLFNEIDKYQFVIYMSNKYITSYIGAINGVNQDLGVMFYNWTSNTVNIPVNGTTVKKYSVNYNKPTVILDTDIQVSMDGSPNLGDQVYTFGPVIQDRICSFGTGTTGAIFSNDGINYNGVGADITSNTASSFYWDGTKWVGGTITNSVKTLMNSYDGIKWNPTGSLKTFAITERVGDNFRATGSPVSATDSINGSTLSITWWGMGSSSDGKYVVAISNVAAENNAYLFTSNDFGVTWTQRTRCGDVRLTAAVSDDGTQIVAISKDNTKNITISRDSGLTWTTKTVPPTNVNNRLGSIAVTPDGSKMIATSWGKNLVYTSTDSGETWTTRTLPISTAYTTDLYAQGACITDDGTKMACCCFITNLGYATDYIYVSTNSGVTWTQSGSTKADWVVTHTTSNGSILIGVAAKRYISTDFGVTWVEMAGNNYIWGISSNASVMIASRDNILETTTNSGANWKTPTKPANTNINSGIVSRNGKYIYCFGAGYYNQKICVSSEVSSLVTDLITPTSIYYNGTIYLLTGSSTYNCTMAYSYDGINWIGITGHPITTMIYAVQWNGSVWLVGGSGTNTLAYSYNGITWTGLGTSSPLPTTQTNAICWIGNKWVIGGASGATSQISYNTSVDGTGTWVSAATTSLFSTTVNSLIWNGQVLIAGGLATNALAYSYDGNVWTGLGITTPFSTSSSGKYVWNGKSFVLSGTGTNTLAYSYNGLNYVGLGTSNITQSYYSSHNTIRPHSITFQRMLTIAVGSGSTNTIAYTNDGIAWKGLGNTIFSQEGNSVRYNGKMWIAGGTGTKNSLAFSYDAYTWYGLGKNIFTQTYGLEWNGNIWVACGSGSNSLAYSYDGFTWFGLRTSIFTTQGNRVAWNGIMWVSVGSGTANTIAYSFDGITWTGLGKAIFSTSGNGISWNGTMWVAVGQGTNTTAYSYDGIIWYTATNTMNFSIANNSNMWVSMGNGGTTSSYSYDGISWSNASSSPFTNGYAITWNGQFWVAAGQGTNSLAYSYNGSAWTGVTTTSIFSSYGYDIYSNYQIKPRPYIQHPTIAVGQGGNTIAYSPDGISWTPLGNTVFSTAGRRTFWNGKIWVACGQGGNSLAYSYDGSKWIGLGATVFTTSGYSATYNGNVWVAVGQGGNTIAYSSNGIQWNSVTNSSTIFTDKGTNVSWNGNTFLACGQGANAFATSTDGVIWSGVSSAAATYASNGINNVITNGYINIAAVNSTVGLAYTYDVTGRTGWTNVSTQPFSSSGTSIAYNGIYFVATGLGANGIAYSSTGTTWTVASAVNCNDICWNGKRFVAVGNNNNLCYSQDGISWYTNSTNIFTNGYGVASNSQVGAFVAPSALVLDNNGINGSGMSASQTLEIVSSDPYYQTGFNNVTVKIETNNIY